MYDFWLKLAARTTLRYTALGSNFSAPGDEQGESSDEQAMDEWVPVVKVRPKGFSVSKASGAVNIVLQLHCGDEAFHGGASFGKLKLREERVITQLLERNRATGLRAHLIEAGKEQRFRENDVSGADPKATVLAIINQTTAGGLCRAVDRIEGDMGRLGLREKYTGSPDLDQAGLDVVLLVAADAARARGNGRLETFSGHRCCVIQASAHFLLEVLLHRNHDVAIRNRRHQVDKLVVVLLVRFIRRSRFFFAVLALRQR